MSILNVFTQDAFTSLQLTTAIDKKPFNPQALGAMGIFEDEPIRTTALAVENRQGKLVIVPTSARGAPATERVTEKRAVRYFETPRLFHADTLYASELQNVREFGTESVFMQVQTEVARRLSGPTGLTASMEYTWEYHRLGAIQGKLLDSDGSLLFNWFNEFGITPAAAFQFHLAAGQVLPGTAPGGSYTPIRPLCNQIVRAMARAGQGAFIPNVTRVTALCDDVFFDQFINHIDVKQTYLNWNAAQDLRENLAFATFPFGGIDWVNYRGSDDNAAIAVPTGTAQFFPVGAPGVFKRALAPGESVEWVNTPGKPIYIIPVMDLQRNMWWRMEAYSYPLHICTRPEMLLTGVA